MKLHLLNFRKYDNVIFDIRDGITKISGESGAGKSTVFEAIYWCLYGKLNDIAPRGGTGPTEVTFELSCLHNDEQMDIRITRTGKKNVSISMIGEGIDREYHSTEAQSHIESIFGTPDTFLMTSYLRAENMHRLIQATPSEKRELTGLLFPGAQKYDIYKDKLVTLRRKDEATMYQINTDIASTSASISTLELSNPWLKTEIPNESTITEASIAQEIKDLIRERDEIKSIYTSYTLYKNQLNALPSPVDIAPIQHELESIQGRIVATVVSGKSKEIQRQQLGEQIANMEAEMNTHLTSIGKDDLTVDKCQQLLSLVSELISISPSLAILTKNIEDLRSEYDTLFTKSIEYDVSIENIEYNRKLEDILECPQCHTKLRHTNTLAIVETDVSPKPVSHNITRNDVHKLHLSLDRLTEKRQALMKQCTRYEEIQAKEPLLKDRDLQVLKENICTYMHLYKTHAQLKQQLSTLEQDQREHISQDEYKQLVEQRKSLQGQISSAIATEQQRSTISVQINLIEDKHNWLSTSQSKIEEIDEKIQSLRGVLQNIKQAKEKVRIYTMYTSLQTKLEKLQKQATTQQGRIDASHSLESLLGQVYQQYVGEKLREIECDICELGKIFFDETMNITLTPGKETSTGTIKPSFDLCVEYDNTQHTDVRAMSTGERKRLSIILLIVLTKYMDGKLMLLDEALVSVGMDTRGIILGELARVGIPIIITSHDDIVGGYQNEIRLD